MAVEVLFGLLVYPVAEIKVDCICSFRVYSTFECAFVIPEHSQTLGFGVEHNSTYRVFLALSSNQKCSLVRSIGCEDGKEIS